MPPLAIAPAVARVSSRLVLAAALVGTGAASGVVVATIDPAAAAEAFARASGVSRVALAPDGETAAVSLHGAVRLIPLVGHGPREAFGIDVAGKVNALAWTPGVPARLWVARHRPAKRRAGQTELVELDLERRRARRVRRLPEATRALIPWPARDALLVLADGSLRTIRLDGMTSGRLFRVGGDPRDAAVVRDDLVVLAEGTRLLVVDLGDAPTPDGMPVRASLQLAGDPIEAIAVAADGASVIVRTGSGSRRVLLAPLRDAGPVDADVLVVRPGPREAPGADRLEPVAATSGAAREPTNETEPEPTNVAPSAPAPSAVEPPVATRPEPAVVEPPPRPDEDLGPGISGRVVGPAAGEVDVVVLLGPDSLMREAARARPAADGRWRTGTLPPGRYRVQLAADRGGVILSDPPFALLRLPVDGDGSAVVPPIRALRRL